MIPPSTSTANALTGSIWKCRTVAAVERGPDQACGGKGAIGIASAGVQQGTCRRIGDQRAGAVVDSGIVHRSGRTRRPGDLDRG